MIKKIFLLLIITSAIINASTVWTPIIIGDIITFVKTEKVRPGIYYKDFAITDLKYNPYYTNMDKVIKENFGKNYRVADWNDLKKFYYEKDGDLTDLFSKFNLKTSKYNNSVFVWYDGAKKYYDSYYDIYRFYYASWHEHNPPSNYLQHDEIDNSLISLGSWDHSFKILAVKKTF